MDDLISPTKIPGLAELEVPADASIESIIYACDYVNMMPMMKFDNGTWIAAVEFSVGGPHPLAYYYQNSEYYREQGSKNKKWSEKFEELKEQHLKNEKIQAALLEKKTGKKSLKTELNTNLTTSYSKDRAMEEGYSMTDGGILLPPTVVKH